MNEMSKELGLVHAKSIAEELYAMINVCFECKTELEANKVRLTLPTGETFCFEVSEVKAA